MAVIYTDKKNQLPKRHEMDFYKTPEEFVHLGLDFLWDTIAGDCRLPPGASHLRVRLPSVLDPGAGDGAWGTALKARCSEARIVGVELRDVRRPPEYDEWLVGNFLGHLGVLAHYEFDLVIGNPPYSHGELFLRRSLDLLRNGGYLLFLLKLSFLQSKGRAEGLFQEFPPMRVAVCKKRPPFTGPGNTDSYAFYCWKKGWHGETTLTWV